jgi:two-component system phosphate regulon sensor histidine kinase PhoR
MPVNGRFFNKLLFSFVLVLFAGLAVLAAMRALTHDLLLGSVVALIVAILLAVILAQRVARRLNRIVDFANRIASGDLTARIDEEHFDEISAVARALDTTANRLERSFSELEGNRRQLAALLDSMQEAVIAVNPQGQVSWSNALMQRISTMSVQVGRGLVHSIRDPEILAAVEVALKQRQVCRARATSIAPGKIFEVNAAPMPDGGAVVVLHDVSEIERAEATRRDFVANVSHELRTPLTCVTGYVETLLDDGNLSEQSREFLHIILKNASRMNRLTEDLLALASIESRDYKLRLRVIPAFELVEDAVSSLSGLVRDSDVILDIGETTEDLVLADSDALNQVFGNLVENAKKYGKSGGRVVVGARSVGAHVEFYVRDFGPGIAYEHLRRIFERFYRVDKARSRESGGTGLGLAIAKHIVLAHSGEIRCESELGMGATFIFTLPRALSTPSSMEPAGLGQANAPQTIEK